MLSMTIREVLTHLKDGKISAKDLCEKCLERSRRVKELNFLITETKKSACQAAAESSSRLSKDKSLRQLEGIPVVFKDNFSTKGISTTCGSRMLSHYVPPYNATMVKRTTQQGAVIIGKANMDEFAMGSGSIDSASGPVINPWRYRFRNGRHRKSELEESQESGKSSSQLQSSLKDHHTESPDDWYIAGGSSGGSAVSVAVGACYFAFGSDTGGSTRNPASHCGVVGLKPTYGLLSRHGLIPLINSMDVPGIITRSVEDTTTVLNVVAGHDVFDSTTVSDTFHPINLSNNYSVKGLHIGIPKEYFAPGTSPDVVSAWRHAADMFESAGAKVSEVSLPHTQYSILCYSVLCCCEVASNMARYDGIEFGHRASNEDSTEELYAESRHQGFNEVVRRRILTGNWYLLRKVLLHGTVQIILYNTRGRQDVQNPDEQSLIKHAKENYDNYFIKAQKVRRLISDDFRKVFGSGVDLLLTPTTLTDAPLYRDFMSEDNRTRTEEHDVYTTSVNLAGIPAITVPACLSSNGLPVGLQFIGNHFTEHKLLSVAQWYEQQVNFPKMNLDHLDS